MPSSKREALKTGLLSCFFSQMIELCENKNRRGKPAAVNYCRHINKTSAM
ncbi:MAG: hypothetical protein J6K88_02940 [Oscillospiraceae bacterium]|nr:hypothetical protein [Oscillospiraceae bacterium]